MTDVKVEINGKTWVFNKRLISVLDNIIEKRKPAHDYFAVLTGIRGCGKSTLGMQMGYYMDHSFIKHPERVCMNVKDFIYQATTTRDSTVMLDEAGQMTGASKLRKDIQEALYKISQLRVMRNNYILCIPNFFDLESSLVMETINHMILCKEEISSKSHYFFFHKNKQMRQIYNFGKQHGRIFLNNKWSFAGTWDKGYVFDEEWYVNKKIENIMYGEQKQDKWLKERDILIRTLREQHGYTEQKIADIIGVADTTIMRSLQR